MVDHWFGGQATARLSNCQAKMHTVCHGWQIRFGHRAEANEILICSCPCGHAGAIGLATKGVLRPPPGWNVEQFVRALDNDGQEEA